MYERRDSKETGIYKKYIICKQIESMPKVSIIIPVYACQDYIGRCIESLQKQTISDIEIIFVNDCTPDDSVEIIKKYMEHDLRIFIINHDRNIGPMMARYNGYKVAKGDYITFMDSDDTLPSDSLEKLLTEADRSGADIVSGTVEYVKDNGEREKWDNSLDNGNDIECVFKSMLINRFKHNLCSRLFKRSLLQNYSYKNYENMRNGEDGLLFYQIVSNCSSIVTIKDVVYEYWQNKTSSSQKKFSDLQMDSYFFTCKEQFLIANKFTSLKKYAEQFIVKSIILLYAKGYNRKFIQRYINKYDLSSYVSYNSLYKLFPIKIAIKYTIQKTFCPIFRNVKQ